MRVGSLFSGIGGLELGLERAGMEVRWQVEIEDFPRRVLEKHWPDVPKYRDVREVGAHNLERVDLIAVGFPCQPVSLAGKRKVQDDDRWLWPEVARIIGELRPGYALLENVPGLLVHGMDEVLGDPASLGYAAEWDCIPAAAVGAPHRRDRLFIVAYPEGFGCAPQEPQRPAGNRSGETEPTHRGQDVAHAASQRGQGDGTARFFFPPAPAGARLSGRDGAGGGTGHWSTEPGVGRLAHGFPSRMARHWRNPIRALGNAVVPQVAEWIGRRIMEADAALREDPKAREVS